MSGPRRLLAWLWTAVWLRWRLMRLEAARLFGGRPTAVAGPDYHLAPIETPVEGLDYDPAELPDDLVAKLELTRAELADRRPESVRPPISRGARRRRVASLATAAVLAIGATGAGAAALVTGSTGVPAMDRLLGIYEAELQPRPDGPNTSIEVPGSDGSRALATSSYVARDGRVCSALTAVEESVRTSVGAVTCIRPSVLASHLKLRNGIVVAVNAVGDRVAVIGLVSDRVAVLRGKGPGGALDVRLGDTWLPSAPGVVPVKAFIALGDRRDGADPLRSTDPGSYVFDAITEDGQRIGIEDRNTP